MSFKPGDNIRLAIYVVCFQGSFESLYTGAGSLPLPRPHWGGPGPGYRSPGIMGYHGPPPQRLPSLRSEGLTSAPNSPLMVTKRESTV